MKLNELKNKLATDETFMGSITSYKQGFDAGAAAVIQEAERLRQSIENYCNANHVWDVNKNHMLYQGSNEQQFLDALENWQRFINNKKENE